MRAFYLCFSRVPRIGLWLGLSFFLSVSSDHMPEQELSEPEPLNPINARNQKCPVPDNHTVSPMR